MEKFKKNVTVAIVVTSLLFGLVGPIDVLAATTPSFGVAATYGVLASTYTNLSAATTINGDVGFTTGPAQAPAGVQTNYGSGAPYATAGINQATALVTLNGQPCTFTFAPGAIDLSTDTTHGPIGVYTPGVYCSTGAMDVGGPLTLNGSGTYIFRPVGALTSTTGSIVTLTGSSACDVFWTPTAATSLASTTTFAGTVVQPSSTAITVGADTTWTGRALAFGGTVTTGSTVTITAPTCPIIPSSGGTGSINVVKVVINDNGGTKTIADFPLFVGGSLVASGVTNNFPVTGGGYVVSETSSPNYTQTFSGDCDLNGRLSLVGGEAKFCIVTNNDIGAPVVTPPVPPLIDVVKVPSPLALPNGPGQVTYTYSLRNIGITVPVTNITMVGDSCSPITLISGDGNADAVLQVHETWIYQCTTTLAATHTNTVVATGWANGLSATDIASATVIVGVPVVPPLIHVTKVPSPLTLLAGGGSVTYTEQITNPGTVPLSNVALSDDKCSPLTFISGDDNGDSRLDATETWTYTCQTTLNTTTTNTAIASGEANGLVVRDFAIATVVVAAVVPALPNTGLAPAASVVVWPVAVASFLVVLLLLFVVRKKQSV